MSPTATPRTVVLTSPSPTTSTVQKLLNLTEENKLLFADNKNLIRENITLKKALGNQHEDWEVYRASYEKLAKDNVKFATENAHLRKVLHNAQFAAAVEKSTVATETVEEEETEEITKQLDKLLRQESTARHDPPDFHELRDILLSK